MVVRIVGAIMSLLALCLAIPPLSLAEHTTEITVTIGDQQFDNSLNPTDPSLNIAGTYTHAATGGSITIANLGSVAQVVSDFSHDPTVDSISLINAKITANNASVTNFPITFKRRMITGPDTSSPLYYKMYAKGLFNQATGSSINLGWYVKNPLSNGFTFLDSKQYTPGLLSFTIAPAGKLWPTSMTNDRVLKVEFALKLANGKYLDFDSTVSQPRKIVLSSSGSPDEGKCNPGDTECVEQEEPLLTLPSQDEASQTVGLTNATCAKMFKHPADRPCDKEKP